MELGLNVSNLNVCVDEKQILNTINLRVQPSSFHVIMGPNGSGKSTLAYSLIGHPNYHITNGTLLFNGLDISALAIDKRAQAGFFLAYQQPTEIPGLTVFNFLKEAHFALTQQVFSTKEFQNLVQSKMDILKIDNSFLYRFLNTGFSGGEKKRLELLQLLVLKPKIAILDEIDSGLDIDAIKIVADGLQYARKENPQLAILLITHYPRLLSYLTPDFVHVMKAGAIVRSGSAVLAQEIEQRGYDAYCA